MPEPHNPETDLLKLLAIINQLHLKAFNSNSRDALIFQIVNETKKLMAYDRASLWDIRSHPPTCLGMSGQTAVESDSPVVRDIRTTLSNQQNLLETQVIDLKGKLPGGEGSHIDLPAGIPSALWVPAKDEQGASLGLWLERWKAPAWSSEEGKVIEHLMLGYKGAWRLHRSWMAELPTKSTTGWTILLLSAALLAIPVPLRVVAPCEVVSKNPVLITAPLEGIIAEMDVKPGEMIHEGQTLFSYDKRVPLQQLKIAEKQVEVTNAQLNRVLTVGLADPASLNEAAVWKIQLAKDNIELDLARYHAGQLDVTAPTQGIALFDNPDDWRGKPVKVGERIMVLSRPGHTKVRILLPERDNIVIETEKPIKIALNISPLTTLYAKLIYVSDYSIVSDKGVPSFTAEAEWVDEEPDIKLGLKGTAILYGGNVPLFYWIIRKPWAKVREIVGM